MDPVTVKFIQLIAAEIFGGILALLGIYLFLRGITGKSDFIVQAKSVKANLTNSAPGTIICLIGAGLIIYALHSSSVTREESILSPQRVLDAWLANSYKVTSSMDVGQVIDTIVGRGENIRFTINEVTLSSPRNLGQIAQQELNDAKYWHIIAVVNKDRHYYDFSSVNQDTQIPKGALLQIWNVSKYNGMDEKTRIQVSAIDRTHGYDELLAFADAGQLFDNVFMDDTFRHFHKEELDLSLDQVSPGNVRNLREFSLKLYGNPKYWRLIAWANPKKFPKDANEDTPVRPNQVVFVPRFSGWPR